MIADPKSKYSAEVAKNHVTSSYFGAVHLPATASGTPQRAKQLKEVAFADMLVDLKSAKKVLMKGPIVNSKVQKGVNGLPLVSSLLNEVGVYGLIFAGGLQYSQYFKKTSPPPRGM